MRRMNEDERGDLECLYKAGQTAMTVGGLWTDTGVNEVTMDCKCEKDNEMKNVSQVKRPENWQIDCLID